MKRTFLSIGLAMTMLIGPFTAVPAQADSWHDEGNGYSYSETSSGVSYHSPKGQFFVPNSYRYQDYSSFRYNFDSVHRQFGGGRGIGYPTTDVIRQGNGTYEQSYQVFERGVIYASRTVENGVWNTHVAAVKTNGNPFGVVHASFGGGGGAALGYPLNNEVAQSPGYWYQDFENGTIYSSPRGAYAVTHDWGMQALGVQEEHLRQGGGAGLGYPTSPERVESPGYSYQTFERGVIYNKNSLAYTVKGGFLSPYLANGSGRGWLGYPTTNESHLGGIAVAWAQSFERGWIGIDGNGRVTFY